MNNRSGLYKSPYIIKQGLEMTVVADIFDAENRRIGDIIKIGERYRIEWVGEDLDLPIKFHIISRILYNSLELAENETYRMDIVNRVTRRER